MGPAQDLTAESAQPCSRDRCFACAPTSDGQSTDGTEASHMHSRDDLSCKRGYVRSSCVIAAVTVAPCSPLKHCMHFVQPCPAAHPPSSSSLLADACLVGVLTPTLFLVPACRCLPGRSSGCCRRRASGSPTSRPTRCHGPRPTGWATRRARAWHHARQSDRLGNTVGARG